MSEISGFLWAGSGLWKLKSLHLAILKFDQNITLPLIQHAQVFAVYFSKWRHRLLFLCLLLWITPWILHRDRGFRYNGIIFFASLLSKTSFKAAWSAFHRFVLNSSLSPWIYRFMLLQLSNNYKALSGYNSMLKFNRIQQLINISNHPEVFFYKAVKKNFGKFRGVTKN